MSELLRVNEIILATTVLIDREIRQNQISIQTQLSDDVPPINGDRVQLQQVLLNLVLNSIESLRLVAVGSRRLVIASAKSNSNSVLISVHDTGKGISPSDLGCLFDPFYTTKSDGMGIGLTISRSIVEFSRGSYLGHAELTARSGIPFYPAHRCQDGSVHKKERLSVGKFAG